MSYDLIERFLRNNLDDDDYKEYSAALDELCTPKRQWVGLTAEEIHGTEGYKETREMYCFARDLEAKLKEKNT